MLLHPHVTVQYIYHLKYYLNTKFVCSVYNPDGIISKIVDFGFCITSSYISFLNFIKYFISFFKTFLIINN